MSARDACLYVKTHRPLLKRICIHEPEQVLRPCEWFIGLFKLSGNIINKLSWVVFQTSWTSEVDIFDGLVNICTSVLIDECYNFVSRLVV